MKKNKKRIIIILLMLLVIIALCIPAKSQAALQSNGGTIANKNLDDWIVQIRKMEEIGGTFGLSETIDTNGLLATTESNGIDCHMEKNTEYGALVILSASSYGNPSKIENGDTTTGNISGVKMNINYEFVAAGAGITNSTYAKNANGKYINNEYNTKSYNGDAMDIGSWHASTSTIWFHDNTDSSLIRAVSGSIFSYHGDGCNNRPAFWKQIHPTRAVVVIGNGL